MRLLTKIRTAMLVALLSLANVLATANPAMAILPAECSWLSIDKSMPHDKKNMVNRSFIVRNYGDGEWAVLMKGTTVHRPMGQQAHIGEIIAKPYGVGTVCVAYAYGAQYVFIGPDAPKPTTTVANIPVVPYYPVAASTDPNPAKTCGESYLDGSVWWEQCMLLRIGFKPGPVDGFHGSVTGEAERRFWYCQTGESHRKGSHDQVLSNLRVSYAGRYSAGCDSNIDSTKVATLENGGGTAEQIAGDIITGIAGTAACALATALGLAVGAVTSGGAIGGMVVLAGLTCEAAVAMYIADGYR